MNAQSWLAAGAALLLALIFTLANGDSTVKTTVTPPSENTKPNSLVVATSSVPVTTIHSPLLPATSTESIAPKKTTKDSSPKIVPKPAPVEIPAAPVTSLPAPVVIFPSVLPPVQLTQSDFDTAATTLRDALVNILCISNGGFKSISGSGVIVAPTGIILTNAHIGQYFLLASDPSLRISCVIRAGSPARLMYEAKLIFISPEWIKTNPDVLSKFHPTGNGEHDLTLLAITKSLSQNPLPPAFPYIPITTSDAYANEPIVIGSYAAQFLTTGEIQSSLYPTVVFGSVKDIFTFDTASIDVLSLGGSAAAQEGSSGGGVADAHGELAGVITTSTIEGDTSTRNLSAVTSAYIRRDYLEEMGNTLDSLFAKSLSNAISDFAPNIPTLEALIKH